MKLILASNNNGKIAEIMSLLPGLHVQTMREIGFLQPIDEPFDTFRQNALIKAQTVYDYCGLPVLSDDSGLCVRALGDAPGVYSARYAGPDATDEANNSKLLRELAQTPDRAAHYIAVLCLVTEGGVQFFEGRCDGTIAYAPKGSGGFGYDPLFIPEGYERTFGEIDGATKGRISHRARALAALKVSGLLSGH